MTLEMMNKESIIERIDVGKNHIDQFVLETEEGTKRTKDKFYRNAVEQRNKYVNSEIEIFEGCFDDLKREVVRRFHQLMPEDKSENYQNEQGKVQQLLNLVKLNSNISNSFKLGIDFVVASIDENTSLEELNQHIKDFVAKFHEVGIILSLDDFKYTMFTEKYMISFFQNADFSLMKDTFEKIYFACPDIKLQLKMNLEYIILKYDKQLSLYVDTLKKDLFEKNGVTPTNVIDRYIDVRYEVGNQIATDEYYNLKLFLDAKKKISDYVEDSPIRVKNYDTFVPEGSYAALSEDDKNSYDSAVMDLYLTLNELKKYFGYEFIIEDLLERYKNKDAAKSQYPLKKKEIEKEEKVRMAIYKEYLKANGIGFLAKVNEVKMKNAMLKMNEQVQKLRGLYDELKDLEITYHLNELSESATIYDLLMASLTSFSFLEKSFQSNEKLMENSLEENMEQYFRFIYNPNNSILRKVNVFTEYDLVEIVAEKYRLLNLNVTKEMITSEAIDVTLESVKFINLIQNINRSNITVSMIAEMCRFQEIASSYTEVI